MATIKSYTDLNQSRKLAEILSLESADMVYIKHSSSYNPTWEFNEDFPPMILGNVPINKMTVEVLPCWSLAALSEILKCCERCNITLRNDKQWNIFATKDGNRFCSFEQRNGKGYDSQLDAYYDVVCWLKEHKFI